MRGLNNKLRPMKTLATILLTFIVATLSMANLALPHRPETSKQSPMSLPKFFLRGRLGSPSGWNAYLQPLCGHSGEDYQSFQSDELRRPLPNRLTGSSGFHHFPSQTTNWLSPGPPASLTFKTNLQRCDHVAIAARHGGGLMPLMTS